MTQKILIDDSVLVKADLHQTLLNQNITQCVIIIPNFVLQRLRILESKGNSDGVVGLKEVTRLGSLFDKTQISIQNIGEEDKDSEKTYISNLTDIAKDNDAVLYTAEPQIHTACSAQITTHYISELRQDKLEFLKFFDPHTMSVHLKEGMQPLAKRGKPGEFTLEKVGEDVITLEYIEKIASEILSFTAQSGSMEISKPGAEVVQLGHYRIVITHPPFSEKYEITIVHPIVNLSLEDYDISEKLMARLKKGADGILISGSPGSGKSTLASGLANFYHLQKKIIKTFESPRDLQVNFGITQYTKLDGSFENSADVLLLVRPDYTIFDEIRRREDFTIFTDIRLSGVGMIGVIHASSPVDAVQRFIGKIELGIIPSVVDTVIFVKDGKIDKVYELEHKVKVPSGMMEQDLARPVIEIRDFETQTVEYEIYTFGEENVIMPVEENVKKSGVEKLAEEQLIKIFKRYDPQAIVNVSSGAVDVMIEKRYIPALIGRGGSNINELQDKLGMHINVREKNRSNKQGSHSIQFDMTESKSHIMLSFDLEFEGSFAEISINGDVIKEFKIDRHGVVNIPSHSRAGKEISRVSKDEISVSIRDF
ncbi:MAG: ATPase, T2SS/T4P/T4SS family [Candidatus Nitrosoabyssus spongiisocia]|nr:MAG: ATPase, T2SS/T4P/T4SS family [Nitrosopumilaceae archaeon AB1(1)]